ncbi:energy transducer TonB [Acidocella facilis]|uniref:energy transducer TonB n=1 Tax=Acidocella facilis TaxID=525 RepID=UPI00047B7FE3|nr:energy transducer TonB [Acidocella facilis]
MTGAAARLRLVGVALAPELSRLRAAEADRLQAVRIARPGWPWRMALLALAAHLAAIVALLWLGRLVLPKPPPEPIAISIVSETAPQGTIQPTPKTSPLPHPAPPAPSAAPSSSPQTPPTRSPAPALPAPPSPKADLPPPPPPAPAPTPVAAPAPPKPAREVAKALPPAAPSMSGAKIKAQKQAAVTVAVLHPAVAFADNQAPDYPRAAILAGEQGVVRFRLIVGPDGRVERFELTQSSGYADLDASVRTAALSWRYQPATRGGVEVPSIVTFHVRFVPH